jgi:8-oxo-dGTP pyrophosphatase MutT (NUDIX family)
VDRGEHPLDAIRREVNEELALDVAEWREVGSFPYAAFSGEPSQSVVFAADITDRWVSHVLREGQATGVFHIDEFPKPIIPLALRLLSHYHATWPHRVSP